MGFGKPLVSKVSVNAADFGADGTGGNYTAQIQAAINAVGSRPGGGRVLFSEGLYVVDYVGTVGTTNKWQYCLNVPSNVQLEGAGIDETIIQLAAVSRPIQTTPYNSAAMIINSNPDAGNVNWACRRMTIDGNRNNQGPYVKSVSLPSGQSFRHDIGIQDYYSSHVNWDDLRVINHSGFGACMRGTKYGTIPKLYSENCYQALICEAAARDCDFGLIAATNFDPAPIVNATLQTQVTAAGVQNVTLSNVTNVAIGSVLAVGRNLASIELVYVSNVVGSTITAYFALPHAVGVGITEGYFSSDAAVAIDIQAQNIALDELVVNYDNAQQFENAALELFNCQNIVVGSVKSTGTTKGVYIHNYSGDTYPANWITIGSVQALNLRNGTDAEGAVGVFVDSNGFPGVLSEINIGKILVSSSAPGAIGIENGPTAKNVDFGDATVLGTAYAYVGAGGTGIRARINGRNQSSAGVLINGPLTGSKIDADIQAPAGSALQLAAGANPTANTFEVIATGVTATAYAIDFGSSATATGNEIRGNVTGATLPYRPPTGAGLSNPIKLIGYNPVGQLSTTAPASNTASQNNYGVDVTWYITGGTVTAVYLNDANGSKLFGPTSGAFRIPQGKAIIIVYSVVPTVAVFGD